MLECNSLDEAQDIIDQHINDQNMMYYSSFHEFVQKVFTEMLNKTEKDDLCLLEMLKTKGSVDFITFCALLHEEHKEVIDLMCEVHPHIYVNPLLQQVTVSSTFTLNVKHF